MPRVTYQIVNEVARLPLSRIRSQVDGMILFGSVILLAQLNFQLRRDQYSGIEISI